MKMFQTNYGYFDSSTDEYVVTTPRTPRPWVNVICPGDWGTVVSQAGGGYSWRTHASLNRITRWEQDIVRDDWGKFVYARDDRSGEIWSLAWQPVMRETDHYQVVHGIGYTVIESRNLGIKSRMTITVPPGEPLELWLVELSNEGDAPRDISLFTYLEWGLGAAPDWHREFHRTFAETRIDPDAGATWASKRLWDIPNAKGQSWNRSWEYTAFHSASTPVCGFECDKEAFLGRYGSPAMPAAVVRGSVANSHGKYGDAIGSIHTRLTIPPRGAAKVVFTLGAVKDSAYPGDGCCEGEPGRCEGEPGRSEGEPYARELIAKYKDPAEADRALAGAVEFWRQLLSPMRVDTPDAAFNLMNNTWLPYQAISGRIWGRTGYYQTGGAYGFRDQLQDSQVFLPISPDRTADQIVLHAAHQYVDGHVDHWWHPISEMGGGGLYSDDLLWLPFVTINYLKETGDFSLLDRTAPYRDSSADAEPESIWSHCIRAIDLSLSRRSRRGLPLILGGDWNDGMNAVGPEGRGESVWLCHFLCTILPEWASIADRRREGAVAARYRGVAAELADLANELAWDEEGGWYTRATCDDGTVLGASSCRYGRVYLNAQVWAIIGGVATPERAGSCWRAVVKNLSKECGPVLFAPAYGEPDSEIGYLTRYAPGLRENGGRYTHASTWAIIAAVMMNDTDEAWKMYRNICPIHCSMRPDVYKAEPYVTAGNAAGPDSPTYCEGGWSWYTGSAAWLFRVANEWLLGVRPEWKGLLVDPHIPKEWDGFDTERRFRGSVYRIHVRNPRHVASGVSTVRVDGDEISGNLLPALGDGAVHEVEVIMG